MSTLTESRDHFKKDAACVDAQRAADSFGLPQTVYKTADTYGWAHTNALANLLSSPGTQVHMTALPFCYFT